MNSNSQDANGIDHEFIVWMPYGARRTPLERAGGRHRGNACLMSTADRRRIERAIVNALRQAIDAHGPITSEHVGSAAKRVYGTLLSGGHLAEPSTDVGPVSL